MIKPIVTAVRVATVFISICMFLGQMSIVFLFVHDRWSRIRISNRVIGYYCRWGLWLLNVKVNVTGESNLLNSGLLVGNHLSYLDILVICSRIRTSFVTSVEIKQMPFLGQIVQMAGCLFVERRNKENLQNEISDIRDGLEKGLNITVFPEATSTNGEQILRFRKPLFSAAIASGRPVIPFCINYSRIGGEKISLLNRDTVMWYGDMPFVSHLWSLAASGSVEVDLIFRPPLDAALKDLGVLAEVSRASVERVFRPVSALAQI